MTVRYWPLGKGRIIASPFGPRPGEFHKGVDFGFSGGSALRPVYAVQSGTVLYAGSASGYGGPDPAGWLVIDSSDAEGGGCLEYGHIIRRCSKGDHIEAGQIIAVINGDQATNGGVAPHLHLSDMPGGYDPAAKQDPMPRLANAVDPTVGPFDPGRAPVVLGPINPTDTPQEDLLSALTDAEQRALFNNVAAIAKALPGVAEDVRQIRAQLGPSLVGWPSLGKNDAGQELTLRDAFGVLKTDVAAVKKAVVK
jgi:murein DD-endopeptidase MepM/ murein hydrolase activator NlpD